MATTSSTAAQTLTLKQGDGETLRFTVQDRSDPPVPQNLTQAIDGTNNRLAIVRFAVKLKPKRQTNAQAVLFLTSYEPEEVAFLDQSSNLGQGVVYIDMPDTAGQKPSDCYLFEGAVTRQDFVRSGSLVGTLTVTADDPNIVGVATAFLKAKQGDVIQPLTGANAGQPRLIIATPTSDTALQVETPWSQSSSGDLFEIRRGLTKSTQIAFTIQQDVVRP